LLAAIALLALFTWLSGDADFRVAQVPGGGLLSGLPATTDGWHVRGPTGTLRAANDGRGVVLSNADSGRVSAFLALPLALDDGDTDGELMLRLRGSFVRLGPAGATLEEPWRTRILIRWLGVAGDPLGYGAVTRFESGTRAQRFEQPAWASEEAASVQLVLVADRAGAWRFSAPSRSVWVVA